MINCTCNSVTQVSQSWKAHLYNVLCCLLFQFHIGSVAFYTFLLLPFVTSYLMLLLSIFSVRWYAIKRLFKSLWNYTVLKPRISVFATWLDVFCGCLSVAICYLYMVLQTSLKLVTTTHFHIPKLLTFDAFSWFIT